MDKALLVGINNYPAAPLRGCDNDIADMASYLTASCGFAMDDVRLLADERATTQGILDRLNWLVDGLKDGDRAFFHYSGHGAQMATRDHQGEIDGLDEVICPVDFDWTDPHVIRDKDFKRIFAAVPTGCEFIWVSDSCHSGDLSRDIPPEGAIWRTFPVPVDIAWRNATANRIVSMRAMTMKDAAKGDDNNVALMSACKSDQTAADATINGRFNGAFTYYLINTLQAADGLKMPLDDLATKVIAAVQATNKYKQVPGIEGSPAIRKKPFLSK